MTHDCLIVGGGVIGLSLAYELSASGLKVGLVDRREPGREASWAGAGILPPHPMRSGDSADEQLAGFSHQLHSQWAARLREETGIDNGYRRSGAIHVARDREAAALLEDSILAWRARDIHVDRLSPGEILEAEPALSARSLSSGAAQVELACLIPEEAQLRNPRHLKALIVACTKQGVELMPGTAVHGFRVRQGRVLALRTDAGEMSAGCVCLAAGCWTAALAEPLGITVRIKPVRGQIVLLACRQPPLERIVNEGRRYLVPRPDGRLLVGSTEEDAGFDCRTTCAGVAGLLDFAVSLAPSLKDAEVERAWAGLRPGTEDGLAYVGRVPGLENAFMAAGHFRSGLQRAPGTAVVLRQLICGQVPAVDLEDSRLDRHHAETD